MPARQESLRATVRESQRTRFFAPAVLLAVLAIACVIEYWPARNGPFEFDDLNNILKNPHIRMTRLDLASLWRALVPYENLNLRPLSFLTFALNHLFGGYDPFGYHIVNLAILLLSIPIAYLLVSRLGDAWLPPQQARTIALGTTALWALHPLLTNGVSYIVQRMVDDYVLKGRGAFAIERTAPSSAERYRHNVTADYFDAARRGNKLFYHNPYGSLTLFPSR